MSFLVIILIQQLSVIYADTAVPLKYVSCKHFYFFLFLAVPVRIVILAVPVFIIVICGFISCTFYNVYRKKIIVLVYMAITKD